MWTLISTCVTPMDAFTGFDAKNNPTWAHHPTRQPSDVILTTVTLPANFVGMIAWGQSEPTANGALPCGIRGSMGTNCWLNHLGRIDAMTGAVRFDTHRTTPNAGGYNGALDNYGGFGNGFLLYPEAPYFLLGGNNGRFDVDFEIGTRQIAAPVNQRDCK
jgi:hypothetical protein